MKSKGTPKKRGVFVAIEGIDGAGTTTQTALIASWLRKKGIKAHATAEPSRGAVGRHIRRILKTGGASPEQLALLFAADRLDHLEHKINPALTQGEWVVTDRYRLSSLAYQSTECDLDWVLAINKMAPAPDLTVLIDIPVKAALARLESRGGARERFESLKYLEEIRANYLEFSTLKSEGNVIIVNGDAPVNDVFQSIQTAIVSLKRGHDPGNLGTCTCYVSPDFP